DTAPQGALAGTNVRSRVELARKDFGAARRRLEQAITDWPRQSELRVLLSHVLLQEGRDWVAARRALCDTLAVDPQHAESRHNLSVFPHQQPPAAHGPVHSLLALADLYRNACNTAGDIHEHLPTLYLLAQRCRHVTEMGTRTGVSTIAWLFAQPERLVC